MHDRHCKQNVTTHIEIAVSYVNCKADLNDRNPESPTIRNGRAWICKRWTGLAILYWGPPTTMSQNLICSSWDFFNIDSDDEVPYYNLPT